jgi:hypothetical protein
MSFSTVDITPSLVRLDGISFSTISEAKVGTSLVGTGMKIMSQHSLLLNLHQLSSLSYTVGTWELNGA